MFKEQLLEGLSQIGLTYDDVNDHDGYWLVYDLILIKVFPF